MTALIKKSYGCGDLNITLHVPKHLTKGAGTGTEPPEFTYYISEKYLHLAKKHLNDRQCYREPFNLERHCLKYNNDQK